MHAIVTEYILVSVSTLKTWWLGAKSSAVLQSCDKKKRHSIMQYQN